MRLCPLSVFPSFQKEGRTQILKISKRGVPEKKFGVGETKTGEDFQNERGNSTFQLKFRGRKGQKWGLLEKI